jgi:adenine deaminase
MERSDLVKAAGGSGKVDLLIENCRLVNVLSGRVHPASVAVSSGMVVGIGGDYGAEEKVDLGGRYLAPGLIDTHVHIESSMVTVPQFASVVVPEGTLTAVTDCHEIANVMGVAGIEYMEKSASGCPMDLIVMLPPCVPATHLETSGADLEAGDLKSLVDREWVGGIGEVMNFPGAIAADPGLMAKIGLFPRGPVEGHAPGLSGMELNAYIAAGPDSDHECTTAVEAEEKLARGMYIYLREGTAARNFMDLLPVVNDFSRHRCCICTDDRSPEDLLERGHINSIIKMAIRAGTPVLGAFQMATINSARRLGLTDRGAVAVGFRADMIVLDDLEEMKVGMAFKDGRLVADNGELTVEAETVSKTVSTFEVSGFSADRLKIPSEGGRVLVIGVVPGQIVTESLVEEARIRGGEAVSDPSADLLKIAVVERHRGTGNVGVGFVRGFGLDSGALASSVAHDSHNIVVVGANDHDMAMAVESVIGSNGGQVVVSGGKVLESLELPVAGLMSTRPVAEVASGVSALNRAAAGLKCALEDPFMTMSFLALPVIPSLKLTDMGLVDVERFELVDLFK